MKGTTKFASGCTLFVGAPLLRVLCEGAGVGSIPRPKCGGHRLRRNTGVGWRIASSAAITGLQLATAPAAEAQQSLTSREVKADRERIGTTKALRKAPGRNSREAAQEPNPRRKPRAGGKKRTSANVGAKEQSVILSGAVVSRSEATTESKDP